MFMKDSCSFIHFSKSIKDDTINNVCKMMGKDAVMNTLKVKETVLQPGRPKVAVPVMGTSPQEIVEECEHIKTLPCDIIEWRADYYLSALGNLEERLQDKDVYLELLKILDDINLIAEEMPVIFTLRTKEQGGEIELTDGQKESLWSLVCQSELIDLIDVELPVDMNEEHENWLKSRLDEIHQSGIKVIMSYHDFDRMLTPQEIVEKTGRMTTIGADVFKFAAMAYSRDDAESLLKTTAYLTKNNIGPIVMMAMGEWGKTTRVAAGRYGSCITFASGRKQSAPGQVDTFTMKKWLDDYYGEDV